MIRSRLMVSSAISAILLWCLAAPSSSFHLPGTGARPAGRRALTVATHQDASESGKARLPRGASADSRRDTLRSLGGLLGGVALATLASPPLQEAQAVLRRSPEEVQFELFKMGLDLTRAFRFEDAEKVYSEIISRAGDPLRLSEREKQMLARAYSNRGNCRASLDRPEQALVDYSKAVELSPDTAEFWLNRGLTYETIADSLYNVRVSDAMQFYDAAIGDYDHAIVLDPNNHRVYINAGDVLTHLARHDEALENYRRALDIFPISPANRGKVALMEVQLGNVEKGTFLVESIVRRNPDYNEMVLASAAIGWTLGRFAEGMDLYQVAVEKDPRLLDDRYLKMALHWPPTMVTMVQQLRQAGTMQGPRAQAVKWFFEGSQI